MTTGTITDLILAGVLTYGAPVFALAIFLAAAGIPIPSTLFVLAGGAFIRQGILDLPITLALGMAGVLVGDGLNFGIGRFARKWIERRLGGSSMWKSAQVNFERRGGAAIFLTRFLFTSLAIPTNLIAGGSGYRVTRFMAYDAAGEVVWFALFGGLGYIFGSQWETISEFISDFSGLLAGLVVLGAGIYFFMQRQRRKNGVTEVVQEADAGPAAGLGDGKVSA